MSESFECRNPEFENRVEEMYRTARFVRHLGIEYRGCGLGWCEAYMELLSHHLQQNDVAHGGAVATLADHTAGAAGTSLLGPSEMVLSVGYSINLLRPGSGEALRCRAEVVRNGRRLVVAQSDVFAISGDMENLIARAVVTLAVLPLDHVDRRE